MGLFIALPSHKWLGYFHSIVEVERAAGFESAMRFRRPVCAIENSPAIDGWGKRRPQTSVFFFRP
jgi:hypothetical protein